MLELANGDITNAEFKKLNSNDLLCNLSEPRFPAHNTIC